MSAEHPESPPGAGLDSESIKALVELVVDDPEAAVTLWQGTRLVWRSGGGDLFEGLVGAHISDAVVADHVTRLCDGDCLTDTGGRTHRVELQVEAGGARWVDVRIGALGRGRTQGEQVGVGCRSIAVWRNASDEMEALAALESGFSALAAGQHRYRQVVEGVRDGITLSHGGVLEWCSPVFSALCSVPEPVGVDVVGLAHPDDQRALGELLDGVRGGVAGRLRVRLAGVSGSWYWLDVHATPLFDGNRSVAGELATWRDASAEVAYLEALSDSESRNRELAEQLQQALDSRVVFEQAKGIIAGARGVSVDVAYEMLRDHSRRCGRKLRDVAHDVVELGLRL